MEMEIRVQTEPNESKVNLSPVKDTTVIVRQEITRLMSSESLEYIQI